MAAGICGASAPEKPQKEAQDLFYRQRALFLPRLRLRLRGRRRALCVFCEGDACFDGVYRLAAGRGALPRLAGGAGAAAAENRVPRELPEHEKRFHHPQHRVSGKGKSELQLRRDRAAARVRRDSALRRLHKSDEGGDCDGGSGFDRLADLLSGAAVSLLCARHVAGAFEPRGRLHRYHQRYRHEAL